MSFVNHWCCAKTYYEKWTDNKYTENVQKIMQYVVCVLKMV
jgi:hypothetical protein